MYIKVNQKLVKAASQFTKVNYSKCNLIKKGVIMTESLVYMINEKLHPSFVNQTSIKTMCTVLPTRP